MTKVKTLSQLLEVHEKKRAWSTILTTDLPDPTGYGRIIRNIDHSLMKIVEEKDATDEERQVTEINSGIYVFDAKILFRILPLVGNNNKQNEYYLPDVLNLIIQEKGKVAIDKIKNYIEIQGVNNTTQLTEVNELYKNE
jgi:bifunctional N-acetylglucosamine-1-phosphate-uridyltransferase/glucosamine-1-phosphate-acetyltransferase GlmU-like protein